MFSNSIHVKYLQSANNLSRRNIGLTGKNPSVACLIVDYSESTKGHVLSYGLTSIGGSPHAEINALNKIKKSKITKKTIMYVSLEPCLKKNNCCSKQIVKKGIKKIFISSLDPNPLIFRQGIEFLKKNDIKVIHSIKYVDEFWSINKYFYTFFKKKRPYITLKLAISKNGFSKNLLNRDITSKDTQYYMHKYRLFNDAILVGYNTYREDNPRLNCRLNGLNKTNYKFIISNKNNYFKKFNSIKLDFKENPIIFLQYLKKLEIKSILVEGGINTFRYFYDNNLFDELIICKSAKNIKVSKKRFKLDEDLIKRDSKLYSSKNYGEDIIEIYKN